MFIFPGSSSGPVANGTSVTQGSTGGSNETGDKFGGALASGDFNKDGWADVAIGIPGEAPRTDPQSGTAAVVPGGNTALGAGYTLEARDVPGGDNGAADLYGRATGDVTGDGFADLLIGAPGRNGSAGRIYLFSGGTVTTARPRSLIPHSMIRQQDVYATDEAGDRFGAALAVGDLSRDGCADTVAGGPGEAATGTAASGSVMTLTR